LQTDMTKVWNRTKLLLLPSLWHESGSRSVLEAMGLGIPVLASASGGTAEMLNQSGFILPLVERDRSNYLAPFSDDELRPWLTQLHLLLDKPDYFAEASGRSREAWENHPKVNSLKSFDLAFKIAKFQSL
jgi:glycosyltransferase involved in cell wall biosynthesis